MKQSPNDDKQYQLLTLPNQLRVLLIENPKAQKAAASLAVNIGHFYDPVNRDGMSHLLEHMLFLGTESHPKPGEFQGFIQGHGGHYNAWTGSEFTNYFFDINPQYFNDALARFSQFFISPLLSAEMIDKEREAVDAEFHLKLKDDFRRNNQVLKELVNTKHPFAKFSVGCRETLNDDEQPLHPQLVEFYQQHYAANYMTLVIIGPQTLAESATTVEQLFSPIQSSTEKSSTAPLSLPDLPLFMPKDLPAEVHIQPVKDIKTLSLAFHFESLQQHYRSKPLHYIASILGHEGPNSLTELLKQQELIHGLSAGPGLSAYNFQLFNINFSLTEKGLQNYEAIIEQCFACLEVIRKHPIEVWRFKEKQQHHQRAFRYQESIKPIDLASRLSINMHYYPSDDTLHGDYAMDEFEPELIAACLAQMQADKVLVTLCAPSLNTDQQAQWYNTPYQRLSIDPQRLSRWQNPPAIQDFALAEPNPFISDELADYVPPKAIDPQPRIFKQADNYRIWQSNEGEYQVPKGHIYLRIDSPSTIASVKNTVLTRLSIELLLDHIQALTYQAEVSGMHYNIFPQPNGVQIHLSGYSEHQFSLLKMILENRLGGYFKPERFAIIKQQLTRHWENQAKAKPINQLFEQLGSILQDHQPSAEQMLEQLKSIELSMIPPFINEVNQDCYLEALIYGAWSQPEIEVISDYLLDHIKPSTPLEIAKQQRLSCLKDQGSLIYAHPQLHSESALMVYFQGRSNQVDEAALFLFANHIMTSRFFNELRTKQQLGYIVGTSNAVIQRHPGMVLYVQSPRASAEALLHAIDAFIHTFPVLLIEYSQQQWEDSKQGLLNQINEPHSQMANKAQQYWASIERNDPSFAYRSRLGESIQAIDRAELTRFMMSLRDLKRDRLICLCATEAEQQVIELRRSGLEQSRVIESLESFHQQTKYFNS